jgi:hypothetical protein
VAVWQCGSVAVWQCGGVSVWQWGRGCSEAVRGGEAVRVVVQ